MISKGYGDLKIVINRKEFITIKSILCGNNDLFYKLVNDTKFNGKLELYNGCTEIGYKNLERFYANGVIEINDKNVIDTLSICVYYNECELMKECLKYMKYHLNEEIVISLLSKNEIMNSNYLKKFEKLLDKYIISNGYKLLSKINILKLSPENIYYILNRKK